MARAPESPDRAVAAKNDAQEDFQDLRNALDFDKPALPYNEAAKLRIGKTITDAVLPKRIRAPVRRLGPKHGGTV